MPFPVRALSDYARRPLAVAVHAAALILSQLGVGMLIKCHRPRPGTDLRGGGSSDAFEGL
jgi:hypothetical protein